jgi:hypothetical protein
VAVLRAIRGHPDWKTNRYPGATINRIRFENIDSGAIFDLAGPVSSTRRFSSPKALHHPQARLRSGVIRDVTPALPPEGAGGC